ncbi:MAG: SMI1/KNR4 family protein [Planctomycetota bacterium]
MQPLDVAIESMTFVTEAQGAAPAAPAPSDEQVAEAQMHLGKLLPPSYVSFMQRAGGVLLDDWDLYWVGGPELTTLRNIVIANELERQHDASPLPPFLVAFCDDGNGDQYCFDTRSRAVAGSQQIELEGHLGIGDAADFATDPMNLQALEYPVVLWDRDQGLAQIRDGLYVVATDFVDWLKQQVHESA